jgi:hypothetical protein
VESEPGSGDQGNYEGPPRETARTQGQTVGSPANAGSKKDRKFKSRVWERLAGHPDIVIGANRDENELSLDDVEALPVREEVPRPQDTAHSSSGRSRSTSVDSTSHFSGDDNDCIHECLDAEIANVTIVAISQTSPHKASDTPLTSNSSNNTRRGEKGELVEPQVELSSDITFQPRICVSEDRMWKGLTGHGVDYSKIPRFEWSLLCEIVASRQTGILQIDLIRFSGQDKRLVPQRTDFLEQKGLIQKQLVSTYGYTTSLLTFNRFIKLNSTIVLPADLPANKITGDLNPINGHELWTGHNINVEQFVRAYIAVMRAWQTIHYRDLCLKMHVAHLEWNKKFMNKTTQKLRDIGVIKATEAAVPDDSGEIFQDYIQFCRELTEEEWVRFQKQLRSVKPSSKRKEATVRQKETQEKTSVDSKTTEPLAGDCNGETTKDDDQHADSIGIVPKPTHSQFIPADAVTISQGSTDNLQCAEPKFDLSLGDSSQPPMLTGSNLLAASELVPEGSRQDSSQSQFVLETAAVEVAPSFHQLKSRPRGRPPGSGKKIRPATIAAGNGEALAGVQSSTPLKRKGRPPGKTKENLEMNLVPNKILPETPSKRISSKPSNPVASPPEETYVSSAMAKRKRPQQTMIAVYTSYDECQRQAGIPGVYFDVPDFLPGRIKSIHKSKKTFLALFKSEKLKDLPWMHGIEEDSDTVVKDIVTKLVDQAVEAALHEPATLPIEPPAKRRKNTKKASVATSELKLVSDRQSLLIGDAGSNEILQPQISPIVAADLSVETSLPDFEPDSALKTIILPQNNKFGIDTSVPQRDTTSGTHSLDVILNARENLLRSNTIHKYSSPYSNYQSPYSPGSQIDVSNTSPVSSSHTPLQPSSAYRSPYASLLEKEPEMSPVGAMPPRSIKNQYSSPYVKSQYKSPYTSVGISGTKPVQYPILSSPVQPVNPNILPVNEVALHDKKLQKELRDRDAAEKLKGEEEGWKRRQLDM